MLREVLQKLSKLEQVKRHYKDFYDYLQIYSYLKDVVFYNNVDLDKLFGTRSDDTVDAHLYDLTSLVQRVLEYSPPLLEAGELTRRYNSYRSIRGKIKDLGETKIMCIYMTRILLKVYEKGERFSRGVIQKIKGRGKAVRVKRKLGF